MTIQLLRSIKKLIELDQKLLAKSSERSRDFLILHIIKLEKYIENIKNNLLDNSQLLELQDLIDEEIIFYKMLK